MELNSLTFDITLCQDLRRTLSYLLESRAQHYNRNRNNTITITQQSTQTHPQRLCLHLEHAGTWPGISWAASTSSSAPTLFSSHCYKLIMGWALTLDIFCFCDWLWDMIHCIIDCINNWQRMYGKILAVLQSFIVLQTFCMFRDVTLVTPWLHLTHQRNSAKHFEVQCFESYF